jgi:ABC-2 type transport system permease protein
MSTVSALPLKPTGASRPFTDIGAMVGRETRRLLRSVDALVTALAIPVSIMLVFVVVFGGAIAQDGRYINYVVPGVLVLCTGFGSAATAISVAQDRHSGTFDRFKTMPIFGPAVLFGHVVASVARNLVSSAVVFGVALLLGFRPDADFGHLVLATLYLAFLIVAFTWLSCAAGLLLSVDAAGSLNFVFLFLPYVSSGFVATGTMPGWLQGFAEYQPFTPIIETLRSLLTGSPLGWHGWAAVLWLAGIGLAGLVAATVLYRRQTAR